MKHLSILLVLTVVHGYAHPKSKSPACAFLKKEKNEIVDLKKPGIAGDLAEVVLNDGAKAIIRRTRSNVELTIIAGEDTAKVVTKDPSLNTLSLISNRAEYELQCSL